MISKRYVLECDWCGDIRFGDSIKSLGKYYSVYRYKSVNPIADELWIKNKSNEFVSKYLSFCCEECAKAYFEDTPEDIGHYSLIKIKN